MRISRWAIGCPFTTSTGRPCLACATGEAGCAAPTGIGEKVITGVFRVPTELAPSPYDQGFFLAGPGFADPLGPLDEVAPSRLIGVMLHDRGDAAAVTAELSLRMPNGDTTNEVAVVGPARRAAGVHANGLRVAAAVAAAAAIFVVIQAVGRQIGARRDEMATLSALGVTRGARAVASALPVILAAVVAGLAAMGHGRGRLDRLSVRARPAGRPRYRDQRRLGCARCRRASRDGGRRRCRAGGRLAGDRHRRPGAPGLSTRPRSRRA